VASAANSLVERVSGIDGACDGSACVDLCLHLQPALEPAMLADHQPLVVVDRGAGAVRVARKALVLGVALQGL
jgi:hypothetical protein